MKPHIDLVETWNNFFRAQLISIITFIMRAGKFVLNKNAFNIQNSL